MISLEALDQRLQELDVWLKGDLRLASITVDGPDTAVGIVSAGGAGLVPARGCISGSPSAAEI